MSFFLTPFVVNNIGSEAYGFVSLANNFTGYAQIITIALNSMSGRFITIAYHKGDKEEASRYLTSTFFANIFLCFILLVPSIFCILNLQNLVNITPKLINDVKILFIFIFATFFISLVYAVFANATFIANRKDLDAKRNIESYIIKAIVLISCYLIFKPKVAYVGIASLATAAYTLAANIRYLKTLTPSLHIKREFYSFGKVKTLLKSGIWASFGRLSSVLSTGLDLLITNLFISATAMGTLSIAKLLPTVMQTFIGTIGSVFAPNYTIAYAKENKNDLMIKIRQSMIILGITSNLCLIVLLVMGKKFFALWIPNQDANQLQILSILTIAGFSINGGVQCIFNIFVITNKVKANALVSFISNFLTIVVVFILLKKTNLGIYAIAGVSTIVTILRNILFSIPYAAYCINLKPFFFFKPILFNLAALITCSLIGITIVEKIPIHSWFHLAIVSASVFIISLVINFAIITTSSEKKVFYKIIRNKANNLQ